MVGNIIIYFSTLASAFHLKALLLPYFPPAEKARQQLVGIHTLLAIHSLNAQHLLVGGSNPKTGCGVKPQDQGYMAAAVLHICADDEGDHTRAGISWSDIARCIWCYRTEHRGV